MDFSILLFLLSAIYLKMQRSIKCLQRRGTRPFIAFRDRWFRYCYSCQKTGALLQFGNFHVRKHKLFRPRLKPSKIFVSLCFSESGLNFSKLWKSLNPLLNPNFFNSIYKKILDNFCLPSIKEHDRSFGIKKIRPS